MTSKRIMDFESYNESFTSILLSLIAFREIVRIIKSFRFSSVGDDTKNGKYTRGNISQLLKELEENKKGKILMKEDDNEIKISILSEISFHIVIDKIKKYIEINREDKNGIIPVANTGVTANLDNEQYNQLMSLIRNIEKTENKSIN